jgi:radical SAM protein with 4Fe4S-binding SPASM domain
MDSDRAKEYLRRSISPQETFEDLLRYPRYVEVETVNACNARCPMCTIAEWERKTPTMKGDLFRKIADDLIAHRGELKRVSLYRDGEPLLDKNMADRIAVLKDGGIPQVTISTNVSLLNERISRDLLAAGLDIIIMSIDSLKKDVYEKIRARLVFEEVLENARAFIRLRDEINQKTQIWIRMIRQQENSGEWPSYYAYWKDILSPADRVYYHNIFNWGGQLKSFQPLAASHEPNLPCVSLWSLLVIFANGDVPMCNIDFNKAYPIGSVRNASIEELWQSDAFWQHRVKHMANQKASISLCENCNVWDEPEESESPVSPEFSSARVSIGQTNRN